MLKAIEVEQQRVQTNPADWYWRDDVMQLEREHIFRKNWQLFARLGQFESAGDYVADTIAGLSVIVVRTTSGELKAFHNVCRHRAGILATESHGNCARLRCIYHGWTYDLDGHLLKAPGIMEEKGFDADSFNLFPVNCEHWNGLVFINFDLNAPGLHSWLGDLVEIMKDFPVLDDDFKFEREEQVAFSANWKTYGDNSCEGYHLALIHRDMSSNIDRQKTIIEARAGEYVNFDVSYKDGQKACWIYKYPNFMIACEPSYINVQSTDPISARNSRIKDYFWFDGDRRKEDIVKDLKASDLVTEEDRNICEKVQHNLEAGIYERGELSMTQEQGTLYFQELVRRDIGARLDN